MKFKYKLLWLSLSIITAIFLCINGIIYYQIEALSDNQIRYDIPLDKNLVPNWKLDLGDNILFSPKFTDDSLIIQTQKTLISIEKKTRLLNWMHQIESSFQNCPPVTDGSIIVAANKKNEIQVFSAKRGELLWESTIAPSQMRNSSNYILDIKIVDDFILVARFNDAYYLIDKKTGLVINRFIAPDRDKLGIQVSDQGFLLINSSAISFFPFFENNNNWKISGNFIGSGTITFDNKLYIYSDDGLLTKILAIDLSTGKEVSNYPTSIHNFSCLAYYQGSLIITGDGIEAIDIKTEIIRWDNKLIKNLTCPAFYGNDIFLRKSGGNLFILDLSNGKFKIEYEIHGAIVENMQYSFYPIISDNEVIIPGSNSSLFGILLPFEK